MNGSRWPLLANRQFVLLQVARFLFFLWLQMQSVAIGWQVYDLTESPLDLGYVGLAIFLPSLLFSFVGGDLADRFSRSGLAAVGFVVLACASGGLAAVTAQPELSDVPAIFLLLTLVGTARSLGAPASAALVAQIVPPHQLPRAIAVGSTGWQLATVIGPSLGGVAYSYFGGAHAIFLGSCLTFLTCSCLVFLIRSPRPQRDATPMGKRVSEGLKFVFATRPILGAISLDLFAVLLGGAVALLPVYAKDILMVGPTGLGLLRSAPAVGAAMMAIYLGLRPLKRRAGDKMLMGVAVFGAATCVFALSTHFWLSFAALLILGAADMISVVVRHTLVQQFTPDAKRGRVSAVNQVFIGASNELGEFESGITAHWFGLVPAALLGGVGTLAVAAVYWVYFKELRAIDSLSTMQSESKDSD